MFSLTVVSAVQNPSQPWTLIIKIIKELVKASMQISSLISRGRKVKPMVIFLTEFLSIMKFGTSAVQTCQPYFCTESFDMIFLTPLISG